MQMLTNNLPNKMRTLDIAKLLGPFADVRYVKLVSAGNPDQLLGIVNIVGSRPRVDVIARRLNGRSWRNWPLRVYVPLFQPP